MVLLPINNRFPRNFNHYLDSTWRMHWLALNCSVPENQPRIRDLMDNSEIKSKLAPGHCHGQSITAAAVSQEVQIKRVQNAELLPRMRTPFYTG